MPETPLFAVGIVLTAHVEHDATDGWRVLRGVLEPRAVHSGEVTVVREAGLPPVLDRVVVQVATRELVEV